MSLCSLSLERGILLWRGLARRLLCWRMLALFAEARLRGGKKA